MSTAEKGWGAYFRDDTVLEIIIMDNSKKLKILLSCSVVLYNYRRSGHFRP
jgi:hypothetical protein